MRRHTSVPAGKFRAIGLLVAALGVTLAAQAPPGEPTDAAVSDLDRNIRALQRESEQLASQADSLVGELRRLEIARDRHVREGREAEAAAAAARQTLEAATARLAALEQERRTRLPDLQAQLVDLYKRGRGRHARLLLGAGSIREFARARRAVAALITIGEQRIAEHERLLGRLRDEHDAIARTARELEAREAEALQARAGAQGAVEAHLALVARIESQREVNARYVAELETVYQTLQREMAALAGRGGGASGAPPAAASSLLAGRLAWPAAGSVTGHYGQTAGRLGGSAVRNGIELAAPEGAPVQAIQSGSVSFAGEYTGFGTLVVLSHGASDYSLYGYLGAVSVQAGQAVEAGAELGRVGRAPAGPPALYFELRVDGQPVDPVQWLEPR